MEQIIFESNCLLRPATFLEDLKDSLFFLTTLIAAIHPLKEYICFYHRKDGKHPFFELYCAIFICCTTCCHSLSLVVICCHSLLPGVTRCITGCHLLSPVVPIIVIHCHSLSLDVTLVCLFINDLIKKLKLYYKNIYLRVISAFSSIFQILILPR